MPQYGYGPQPFGYVPKPYPFYNWSLNMMSGYRPQQFGYTAYPYQPPYYQYQPTNYQYLPPNYQYPPYYPYQTLYVDTDLMLTPGDEGDDFTVDKGDTISIILPSSQSDGFMWYLDTSELDTDVVSKKSSQYFQGGSGTTSGTEQWIFEAEDTGTTTIILEYRSLMVTGMVQYNFEFRISVED